MAEEQYMKYLPPETIQSWITGHDQFVSLMTGCLQARLEIENTYRAQMTAWIHKYTSKLRSVGNQIQDILPIEVLTGFHSYLDSSRAMLAMHVNLCGDIAGSRGIVKSLQDALIENKPGLSQDDKHNKHSIHDLLDHYKTTVENQNQLIAQTDQAKEKYLAAESNDAAMQEGLEETEKRVNDHVKKTDSAKQTHVKLETTSMNTEDAFLEYRSLQKRELDTREHFKQDILSQYSTICTWLSAETDILLKALVRLGKVQLHFNTKSLLRERVYQILTTMLAKLESTDPVSSVDEWCDGSVILYRFPSFTGKLELPVCRKKFPIIRAGDIHAQAKLDYPKRWNDRKKDGNWRACLDYRSLDDQGTDKVNSVAHPDWDSEQSNEVTPTFTESDSLSLEFSSCSKNCLREDISMHIKDLSQVRSSEMLEDLESTDDDANCRNNPVLNREIPTKAFQGSSDVMADQTHEVGENIKLIQVESNHTTLLGGDITNTEKPDTTRNSTRNTSAFDPHSHRRLHRASREAWGEEKYRPLPSEANKFLTMKKRRKKFSSETSNDHATRSYENNGNIAVSHANIADSHDPLRVLNTGKKGKLNTKHTLFAMFPFKCRPLNMLYSNK